MVIIITIIITITITITITIIITITITSIFKRLRTAGEGNSSSHQANTTLTAY
jgi:hypothetical protein